MGSGGHCYAVRKLTKQPSGFLTWYVGRMWKSLELWSSQVLDCCNQSLKGDAGDSAEEQNAVSPGDSEGCAH